MGQPKLQLPFGPETMLQRVVRILESVVSPIVVVASAGQELPELPENILIAYDEQPQQGPLHGITVGLAALSDISVAAYISACDVPLLKPEFVAKMILSLEDYELAIPQEENHFHPLAAVYKTHLAKRAQSLIESGKSRPFDLIQSSNTNRIDVAELKTIDPELDSLYNVNTPEEYQSALARAGFTSPQSD